ncbi:MAG: adenosylcobinamide-phosphate synthase CbiB [Myxococcota bacterium]
MSLLPWDAPLLHAVVLFAALAWDRFLGEPPHRLHPVVWMGQAIGWARERAPKTARGAFGWGVLMATLLPLGAALLALLVWLPAIGPLVGVWLLTSCFAARGLADAGLRVADALERGDLAGGRAGLGWLCSRDPSALDAVAVSAAATESVAENTSDSLVAPLMWYAIGGLPAALAYRCVNTLDAMVGYRGRYEWLGKASARLDDLLNLLPARLTAALLLCFAPSDTARRRGMAILMQDRGRTASPNAGWPMAAMAGLLGVELAKPGHYVLGEGLNPCSPQALRDAVQICERAMRAFGLAIVGLLLFCGALNA